MKSSWNSLNPVKAHHETSCSLSETSCFGTSLAVDCIEIVRPDQILLRSLTSVVDHWSLRFRKQGSWFVHYTTTGPFIDVGYVLELTDSFLSCNLLAGLLSRSLSNIDPWTRYIQEESDLKRSNEIKTSGSPSKYTDRTTWPPLIQTAFKQSLIPGVSSENWPLIYY